MDWRYGYARCPRETRIGPWGMASELGSKEGCRSLSAWLREYASGSGPENTTLETGVSKLGEGASSKKEAWPMDFFKLLQRGGWIQLEIRPTSSYLPPFPPQLFFRVSNKRGCSEGKTKKQAVASTQGMDELGMDGWMESGMDGWMVTYPLMQWLTLPFSLE